MSGGLWNAPSLPDKGSRIRPSASFPIPLSYPRVLSMLYFGRQLPFIWGALNSVKKCGILLMRRIWMRSIDRFIVCPDFRRCWLPPNGRRLSRNSDLWIRPSYSRLSWPVWKPLKRSSRQNCRGPEPSLPKRLPGGAPIFESKPTAKARQLRVALARRRA